MNELELISAMLWNLNDRLENMEPGYEATLFLEHHKCLQTLIKQTTEFHSKNSLAIPAAMTIDQAYKIAAEKVGSLAPLIRCWPNKFSSDGGGMTFKCAIGFGGAGRDHIIVGAGDTWEQAVNAFDAWLVGPKHDHCNICNNPDCDTPNQKH